MAVLRYRNRDRRRPLSQQRRRIGGIVGGEEPPKNILENGKYKLDITFGKKNTYVAFDVRVGSVYVYASSESETNNINIYTAGGQRVSGDGLQTILEAVENICSNYDNYKGIQRRVDLQEQLANFDTYIEL